MVKSNTFIFTKKSKAVETRKQALKNGHAVGRITKINERHGKTTYKYKLKISIRRVK